MRLFLQRMKSQKVWDITAFLYEDGKYYIVYHARDYGDIEKKEDTRSARIDELIVDDGKLSVKRL